MLYHVTLSQCHTMSRIVTQCHTLVTDLSTLSLKDNARPTPPASLFPGKRTKPHRLLFRVYS